jgi:hypothetical protein
MKPWDFAPRRWQAELGTLLTLCLSFAPAGQAHAAGRALQSTNTSLPAGTVLFIRLDTAVSTQTSHLHAPIDAHVVREVSGAQGIAIPLGAPLTGTIEKLIPTSSPTDRARLLLNFNSLEPPGQAPLTVAAHVTDVENARETVKADGTIQGVLASEVPLSLLDNAIGKLGKLSESVRKQEVKQFGKTNTSIELPAGTDLVLALDKPLEVSGTFSSSAAGEAPSDVRTAVNRMLVDAPQRASGKGGKPGDPLNLIFVGSEDEIRRAFEQAGWSVPEKSSRTSISHTTRAAVGDVGYGTTPISDLYLYGKKEELAFEKMFNTFAKRHHLRLWRSLVKTSDGREIWLSAGTHDIGIDIHPGVVSHEIDPNIDLERDKVGADLMATGNVAAEQLITPPNPLSEGMTATGGTWKTDGHLRLIVLKPLG